MTDVALERERDLDEDEPKLPQEAGRRIAREAIAAEEKVSGAQLADLHGMSERWWRFRLSEVREQADRAAARSAASGNEDPARLHTADTAVLHAVSTVTSETVPVRTPAAGTRPAPAGQAGSPGTADRGPARVAVPTGTLPGKHLADPDTAAADSRSQVGESSTVSATIQAPAREAATARSRPEDHSSRPTTGRQDSIDAPNSASWAPERLSAAGSEPRTHLSDPLAGAGVTRRSVGAVSPGALAATAAPNEHAGQGDPVPTGTAAATSASQAVPPGVSGTVTANPASTTVPPGTESASSPARGTDSPARLIPVSTASLHAADTAARDAVPGGNPAGTEPPAADRPAVPDRVEPLVELVDQAEIRRAAVLQYVFYVTAAVFALVGQVWAGVEKLPFPAHWPVWGIVLVIAPAFAVIELAGVATSHQADLRRRLGEQAYGYRTLSLLAAVVAAGFNLAGHWGDWFPAIGFTGLSVFAYCSWLMQSNARRRDTLRAAGQMARTAPVYGVLQWIREPQLTKRARTLAVEYGYGVHESLRLARDEIRTEARRKAIAAAIERRIREDKDEIGATIAATTYDLDRLADEVKERLDYAKAADFIAADLVLQLASNDNTRTGERA